RPLFPKSGRTIERGVCNPDGRAGTCRGLADCAGRRAVDHQRIVLVALVLGRVGENVIARRKSGGLGKLQIISMRLDSTAARQYCWGKIIGRLQKATEEISLWICCFQSGLRAQRSNSLEGGRLL